MSGSLRRKSANRRNEPARGKGRPDADRQRARVALHRHLRGQICERVEQRCEAGLIGAPGGGHRQPVRGPLEQRNADPVLEQMHHPADRSGGHVQFAGRAREAAMPRRLRTPGCR